MLAFLSDLSIVEINSDGRNFAMMGGNFGSAAGAFLLLPVIAIVLAIGVAIGFGGFALWSWLF